MRTPHPSAVLRGQSILDREQEDCVASNAVSAETDQGSLPLVDNVLEMPWSPDPDQYTFFDGPNDVGGLTQDLDWLFGHSPGDGSIDAIQYGRVNNFQTVTPPTYEASSTARSQHTSRTMPISYRGRAFCQLSGLFLLVS